ncbi:hypothetical protein [Gordonia sp. (in: high G+C Gram-positive bacteria)]|uniref:hypothetical protein n=1 Tax=Gordonia sp. (in: high G+C Gram-positive bacteria) TaxID=84139 RepID=UPI0039E4FDB7
MTADIPEIQYTYVCGEGDARRFTRDGLWRYYRHSRRPWIVLAVQTVIFAAIAALTGWWWLLVLVPLTLALAVAIDTRNVRRRFRAIAAPGTEWASGFGDTAFRVIDGGAQSVIDYSQVASVQRMERGYLVIRTVSSGILVLPPEIAPRPAEQVLRGGMVTGGRPPQSLAE